MITTTMQESLLSAEHYIHSLHQFPKIFFVIFLSEVKSEKLMCLKIVPAFISLDFHNKIAQTQCLHNENPLSYSSGSWKSQAKVQVGFISPKVSFLGFQIATCLVCPHMVISLCRHATGLCLYLSLSCPPPLSLYIYISELNPGCLHTELHPESLFTLKQALAKLPRLCLNV